MTPAWWRLLAPLTFVLAGALFVASANTAGSRTKVDAADSAMIVAMNAPTVDDIEREYQDLRVDPWAASHRPSEADVDAALEIFRDELQALAADAEFSQLITAPPEILGVEGWVRLNSCSGWLVVNMRASCYILETYTRGDCRVEGLSNY